VSGEGAVERALEEAAHRPDACCEGQFLVADDEHRDALEMASLELGIGRDVDLADERRQAPRLGALLEQRLEIEARPIAEAAARPRQELDCRSTVPDARTP
jgi:hypothetical protein